MRVRSSVLVFGFVNLCAGEVEIIPLSRDSMVKFTGPVDSLYSPFSEWAELEDCSLGSSGPKCGHDKLGVEVDELGLDAEKQLSDPSQTVAGDVTSSSESIPAQSNQRSESSTDASRGKSDVTTAPLASFSTVVSRVFGSGFWNPSRSWVEAGVASRAVRLVRLLGEELVSSAPDVRGLDRSGGIGVLNELFGTDEAARVNDGSGPRGRTGPKEDTGLKTNSGLEAGAGRSVSTSGKSEETSRLVSSPAPTTSQTSSWRGVLSVGFSAVSSVTGSFSSWMSSSNPSSVQTGAKNSGVDESKEFASQQAMELSSVQKELSSVEATSEKPMGDKSEVRSEQLPLAGQQMSTDSDKALLPVGEEASNGDDQISTEKGSMSGKASQGQGVGLISAESTEEADEPHSEKRLVSRMQSSFPESSASASDLGESPLTNRQVSSNEKSSDPIAASSASPRSGSGQTIQPNEVQSSALPKEPRPIALFKLAGKLETQVDRFLALCITQLVYPILSRDDLVSQSMSSRPRDSLRDRTDSLVRERTSSIGRERTSSIGRERTASAGGDSLSSSQSRGRTSSQDLERSNSQGLERSNSRGLERAKSQGDGRPATVSRSNSNKEQLTWLPTEVVYLTDNVFISLKTFQFLAGELSRGLLDEESVPGEEDEFTWKLRLQVFAVSRPKKTSKSQTWRLVSKAFTLADLEPRLSVFRVMNYFLVENQYQHHTQTQYKKVVVSPTLPVSEVQGDGDGEKDKNEYDDSNSRPNVSIPEDQLASSVNGADSEEREPVEKLIERAQAILNEATTLLGDSHDPDSADHPELTGKPELDGQTDSDGHDATADADAQDESTEQPDWGAQDDSADSDAGMDEVLEAAIQEFGRFYSDEQLATSAAVVRTRAVASVGTQISVGELDYCPSEVLWGEHFRGVYHDTRSYSLRGSDFSGMLGRTSLGPMTTLGRMTSQDRMTSLDPMTDRLDFDNPEAGCRKLVTSVDGHSSVCIDDMLGYVFGAPSGDESKIKIKKKSSRSAAIDSSRVTESESAVATLPVEEQKSCVSVSQEKPDGSLNEASAGGSVAVAPATSEFSLTNPSENIHLGELVDKEPHAEAVDGRSETVISHPLVPSTPMSVTVPSPSPAGAMLRKASSSSSEQSALSPMSAGGEGLKDKEGLLGENRHVSLSDSHKDASLTGIASTGIALSGLGSQHADQYKCGENEWFVGMTDTLAFSPSSSRSKGFVPISALIHDNRLITLMQAKSELTTLSQTVVVPMQQARTAHKRSKLLSGKVAGKVSGMSNQVSTSFALHVSPVVTMHFVSAYNMQHSGIIVEDEKPKKSRSKSRHSQESTPRVLSQSERDALSFMRVPVPITEKLNPLMDALMRVIPFMLNDAGVARAELDLSSGPEFDEMEYIDSDDEELIAKFEREKSKTESKAGSGKAGRSASEGDKIVGEIRAADGEVGTAYGEIGTGVTAHVSDLTDGVATESIPTTQLDTHDQVEPSETVPPVSEGESSDKSQGAQLQAVPSSQSLNNVGLDNTTHGDSLDSELRSSVVASEKGGSENVEPTTVAREQGSTVSQGSIVLSEPASTVPVGQTTIVPVGQTTIVPGGQPSTVTGEQASSSASVNPSKDSTNLSSAALSSTGTPSTSRPQRKTSEYLAQRGRESMAWLSQKYLEAKAHMAKQAEAASSKKPVQKRRSFFFSSPSKSAWSDSDDNNDNGGESSEDEGFGSVHKSSRSSSPGATNSQRSVTADDKQEDDQDDDLQEVGHAQEASSVGGVLPRLPSMADFLEITGYEWSLVFSIRGELDMVRPEEHDEVPSAEAEASQTVPLESVQAASSVNVQDEVGAQVEPEGPASIERAVGGDSSSLEQELEPSEGHLEPEQGQLEHAEGGLERQTDQPEPEEQEIIDATHHPDETEAELAAGVTRPVAHSVEIATETDQDSFVYYGMDLESIKALLLDCEERFKCEQERMSNPIVISFNDEDDGFALVDEPGQREPSAHSDCSHTVSDDKRTRVALGQVRSYVPERMPFQSVQWMKAYDVPNDLTCRLLAIGSN